MADLVNDTHKSALSSRNAEPSHLTGASYEVLGGPGVASQPNGDDYKIDAGKGVSTDTSIPKSVGAEPSHLKTEEDGDVDVSFGDDEITETDDLDAALDQFEEVDPVDVDVDVKEEDEDDKFGDDLKEDDEDDKDKSAVTEDDEEDKDKSPVSEEDDDKSDDDLKEEDEDDKDKNPFAEDDEEDKDKSAVTEEDDDKDADELKAESVKIRIKLPNAKLFESAGFPVKHQKKAAALFESALKDATRQASKQIHAHYKKLHESKLARRDAVMAKQMDAYLTYVVEEWVKQNRVAIRQSLRAQLAEEFLNGLQRLFKEHYIDVPESKVNVVKKLTEQNEKLRKSLNEQVQQKLKLRKIAEQTNKARIVAEFGRNLSEEQVAKLHKLAENTQYVNAKDFRSKLQALTESYFPAQAKKLVRLPEETVVLKEEKVPTKVASDDPAVAEIAATLSRQAEAAKW